MLEIGFAIYYERLEKGMTQEELALKCGIPQPNLSAIEKGKRDITVSTLQRISTALGVPATRLIEENPVVQNEKPKLTRDFLEAIARCYWNQGKTATKQIQEVTALFEDLIPRPGKRLKVKATHLAWIRVKKVFTSQEIRVIYQRILDEKMRRHEN